MDPGRLSEVRPQAQVHGNHSFLLQASNLTTIHIIKYQIQSTQADTF